MKGVPNPEALLANATWVRGLARRLTEDEHLAEDVVQDAYTAALKAPPRAPRAWLGRVVRNLASTALRRKSRRARREALAARPESTPSTADLVARAELQRGYLMEFTGSFSLMFFLTGAMFISSGLAWAALMKGDVLF